MAKNTSRISIDAPIEKVWAAITEAEPVKQWQYGSELQTSWEVGSSIRFVTPWEGQTFEQWGKVLEYRPTELVRYSLFAPRPGLEDKPENYFVMSYILKEEDGKTMLEIVQEDNRPSAVQQEDTGEESAVLQALKRIAETK